MSRETRFPRGVHHDFAPIRPGHFWFETRREIIVREIGALPRHGSGLGLEIGCGDGFVLSRLPGRRWIGVEQSMEDARTVNHVHGNAAVVASGVALPLRTRFDVVAALDVLEHLADDVGALRAWRAALAPEGRLVVTVPAGPELWSRRDDFAGHVRRYTRPGLRRAVEAAGFEVESLRPLFRSLWPAAWIGARLQSRGAVTDAAREYSVAATANALLRTTLRLEERLFGRSERGRGTSWLLMARPAPPGLEGVPA